MYAIHLDEVSMAYLWLSSELGWTWVWTAYMRINKFAHVTMVFKFGRKNEKPEILWFVLYFLNLVDWHSILHISYIRGLLVYCSCSQSVIIEVDLHKGQLITATQSSMIAIFARPPIITLNFTAPNSIYKWRRLWNIKWERFCYAWPAVVARSFDLMPMSRIFPW